MWEKILFHRKESEPKIETEKNKKEYEKAKKEAEITTFKEEREKYKFLLSKIEDIVRDLFPLTPSSILQHLDLRRPIFYKTASYGHFGREDPDFKWEKTDKVDLLRKEAGLKK